MFSRSSSRVAHRSDHCSDQCPPPLISSSPLLKAPSFHLRRKFHLGFLRCRTSSLLRLLRNLAFSCRHALQAILRPRKKPKTKSRPPHSNAGRLGVAFSAHCTRSACTPDAIADCIEFIKKSSSSSSSVSSSPTPCSSISSISSFLSSQPSSPSRSSSTFSSDSRLSRASSPSLSSRLVSAPSEHSDHQLPACSHYSMESQRSPL